MKEELEKLDAELIAVYETKNILTDRVERNYHHPYEVVVSFPASMGERGLRFSDYYDAVPPMETICQNFRKQLKKYIRPENFMTGIIYTPTAYDEQRIKIAKKVLKIKK